jgi:twitching motility protein PilT
MPLIDNLLLAMEKYEASDLHMVVDQRPKYRVHGDVVSVEGYDVIDEREMEKYLLEILSEEDKQRYLENLDFDFGYGIVGKARFRCNYFFQRTGYAAVFRIIPENIQSIDDLGLPETLKKMTQLRNGLVLCTGPTGSGKSTTLAAMIDYMNTNTRRHIVTIEDPIEFVHKNKQSVITHRETHNHTKTFGTALRAAIRQDVDVILVGEMRDLETIALALTAAATGALVFGTLHTNSASKTIDRIIDVFPEDEQAQIKTMLAESLRGIVAQLLLKRIDKGRVAANEILLSSQAVTNIIREGRVERLIDVMQAGKKDGMQLMDDVIDQYVKAGLVSGHEAFMNAHDKRRFEHLADKAEV